MHAERTDPAVERATQRLKDIWPDYFEGVKTRAGVDWAEMVVHAVRGALREEGEDA